MNRSCVLYVTLTRRIKTFTFTYLFYINSSLISSITFFSKDRVQISANRVKNRFKKKISGKNFDYIIRNILILYLKLIR